MEVVKQINMNYKLFQEVNYIIIKKIESEKILDEKFWDDMIKEADKNGDGEIDYNEFIEMMDKFSLMP